MFGCGVVLAGDNNCCFPMIQPIVPSEGDSATGAFVEITMINNSNYSM